MQIFNENADVSSITNVKTYNQSEVQKKKETVIGKLKELPYRLDNPSGRLV